MWIAQHRNVPMWIILTLMCWKLSAAMEQFINSSSPLRPIFVVNFDLSIFICQHSEKDTDLHVHKISEICNGKTDCYASPAMSDESFPFCSAKCSPNCTENGACLMDGGRSQCYCDEGYGGKACDIKDRNECSDKPCHWLARCTNTLGSYVCACMPGFTGDGYQNCTDIDECGDSNLSRKCPKNSKCCNIPGSYFCNCTAGFSSMSKSTTDECVDIDECATGEAACPTNTSCQNTVGSFRCVPVSNSIDCQPGYEASRDSQCIDVDECAQSLHNCDPRAQCINIPGSFKCVCDVGFTGNGQTCDPLADCSLNKHICHEKAFCIASLRMCFCESGYIGDGIVCTDLNECSDPVSPCRANETCLNTPGGFVCCAEGQNPSECKNQKSRECSTPCDANAHCVNGECVCKMGYKGDSLRQCVEVDCRDNFTVCGDNAVCLFSQGVCVCQKGFEKDNRTGNCIDINECSRNPCALSETCLNKLGTYTCCGANSALPECQGEFAQSALPLLAGTTAAPKVQTLQDACKADIDCGSDSVCEAGVCRCNSGFIGGPPVKPCVDADECLLNLHNCDRNSTCQNFVGGFKCLCADGYYNPVDDHCVDVDECEQAPCHTDATCHNTPGSFECICRHGYQGDGYTCGPTDKVPCWTPEQKKQCGAHMECYAKPRDKGVSVGSFFLDIDESLLCRCNKGYKFLPGNVCEDIDECVAGNRCSDLANCENTEGSYTCTCKEGYAGDGFVCNDIDECKIDPCHPNATCFNTPGSFICTCNDKFTGDGRHCSLIGGGTCASKTCDANAFCVDIGNGLQACHCKPGFAMNASAVCIDIDECTTDRHTCDLNRSRCINNEGSYSCRCNSGWTGSGGVCTDVNECASQGVCDINAQCINTNGGYRCECSSSFSGNGHVCRPIDVSECPLTALADCDGHNMTCILDVNGQPECFQCKPGYSGPKHHCVDIDECAPNSTSCSPEAQWCKNDDGGFRCGPCRTGFMGDGIHCSPVETTDECAHPLKNDCSEHAECVNVPNGGHFCTCRPGFIGDGQHCDDIDECFTKDFCGPHSTCVNTVGSFTCTCLQGYTGGFRSCSQLCADGRAPYLKAGSCTADLNKCPNGFVCENTLCCPDPNRKSIDNCDINPEICDPNAYCDVSECFCNVGFRGNGTKCEDINECKERSPCFESHVCLNTLGSYKCCRDLTTSEECTRAWNCNINLDVCHVNATCQNGKCVCNGGFFGNGHLCTSDRDDCLANPDRCGANAHCEERTKCVCDVGYSRDTSSDRCTPVEKGEGRTDCTGNLTLCHPNGECNTTTKLCQCSLGYLGDGQVKCSPDPLDCYLNPHLCTENQRCIDRRCNCTAGHADIDGTCVSTGELDCVKTTNLCHVSATCNETERRCVCSDGFLGNGLQCAPDPTDCGYGSAICDTNAECIQRRCRCRKGFLGDGIRACYVDPDNCENRADMCDPKAECLLQTTRNGKELHRCICRDGFTGDGRSCEPIENKSDTATQSSPTRPGLDPCTARYLNDCGDDSVCTVLASGGWRCECKPGYKGDGKSCTDIDECEHITCGSTATCRNTPGSYVCACLPGYDGRVGQNCTPWTGSSGLRLLPGDGREGVDVECEGDGITLVYRSAEAFGGRIFVKSQSQNPYCSREFSSTTDGPVYRFKAPFAHCDIKKEPANTFSVVVVIQPHPLFITQAADAYNLKCTYATGEKMVFSHFNVSMLSTHATYEKQAPMGQCTLRVMNPSTAEQRASAVIGQLLQLRLSVQPSDLYGVFAKNCIAMNMDEGDSYILTDDTGCTVDPAIFPNWDSFNDSVVMVNFMTFKWPDTTHIRFQCDCVICFDKCPPANCPRGHVSYGRKRRFAVFEAGGDKQPETLPVFSTVMTIYDADGTQNGAQTAATGSDQGAELLESAEQDDNVCVPTASFGVAVAFSALLGLTVLLFGACGTLRVRRRGSTVGNRVLRRAPVGVVNPIYPASAFLTARDCALGGDEKSSSLSGDYQSSVCSKMASSNSSAQSR